MSKVISNCINNTNYPTAQEIANAIVAKQRDVTPVIEAFSGTNMQSLAVPAGARGAIKYIADHGGGLVRISIDGTDPNNDNYAELVNRNDFILSNVDLSKVRLNATSGSSDYSIYYEIYN